MKKAYICPRTTVVGTLRHDLLDHVSYDVDNTDELGTDHGVYEDTDEELEIMSDSRESSDDEGDWGDLW